MRITLLSLYSLEMNITDLIGDSVRFLPFFLIKKGHEND